MKILVTGSNGQLGKELQQLASSFPHEFVFLSREDFPIHHFELVRNTFQAYRPQYCINCAAYTAVDKAESEKDIAFVVNGEAPGVLAAVCSEFDCRFIHISTDYVFDGTARTPYREDDATNPQGIYGLSKLEGERRALKANPASIIIRTSWVYSAFGRNFVKTIIRLLTEKTEINVVADQFGSPTYAADLADAILGIIQSLELGKGAPGIYNYSNDAIISWYDFAVAIHTAIHSSCKIHPISTAQYPTPAKRPAYSVLDKTKIRQTFGCQIKDWKLSLVTCINKLL